MRKCARIGNDRAAGIGKLRFEFARDSGIEGGKDNLGRAVGLGGRNRHPGDVRRDRGLQPPARRFGVRTAFGAIGGREPRHFKPRMMLQHLDKALADDAGGTENSYR